MYNTENKSLEYKKIFIDEIVETIFEFDPEIIIFDTNYVPTIYTLNEDDVKSIRNRTGKICIGYMGDFRSEADVDCAKKWAKELNFVYHSFIIPPINVDVPNIIYIPYTCAINRYYRPEQKTHSLFFSGIGNIARMWYLLKAKKFAGKYFKNYLINFFASSSGNNKAFLKQDQYDNYLRKSVAILDLTHWNRKNQSTSGRMFQALASETLIIAEECDAMNKILNPFTDYLPFKNGKELDFASTLLRDEHDLCKEIASNGRKKFLSIYSPNVVWAQILDQSLKN